jgi:hypothetical protein
MDINTQLIDMDVLVSEQISKNSDGSYTIFINARLSHERQIEAYAHALRHIQENDFEKENADQIEVDAHKKF